MSAASPTSHTPVAVPRFARLASIILNDLGDRSPASFRVSVRRADKRFPRSRLRKSSVKSADLIKEAKGWLVDLNDPELTIHIEMLTEYTFYFFGKEPGVGGLPTGTGGRLACLLSGGIDSPVAAFKMMRRGCLVLLIHFHSYPILSRASQEKSVRSRRCSRVPASVAIDPRALRRAPAAGRTRGSSPELRVVIYRRLMLRIAETLARQWHARALVTGEVVGQVASQTLENMTTIAEAASLEILRPLVGMDKDEITANQAQALGTLPISNIPDQDCCQLFTPRFPATRVTRDQVARAESALPIDEMVRPALSASAVEDFEFPVLKYAAGRRT